ncbi:receptor mediated endocytosis 8 [Rhipicephalus microplus]|uniref:receptor mediated endocytosis 8 n=1 Tax=Rhipicephalus microplus TaxID=6941 RepID=UPI003F6C023A
MTMTADAMIQNQDVACYLVTKLSWKGKYARVFSVGTQGIRTYSLPTMEITNQWSYGDFLRIQPLGSGHEFSITFRKGRKGENSMRFLSEHRADIITRALDFKQLFAEPCKETASYRARKVHWSDNEETVELELGCQGFVQKDPARKGRVLGTYPYRDLRGMAALSDVPGGLVLATGHERLHTFIVEKREELMKRAVDWASHHVGVQLSFREPMTRSAVREARLGRYSTDEALTSLCEFVVHKISPRHEDPVRRLLCLTESCLLERDPSTYTVVTLRPLADVCRIVRSREQVQQFSIEYAQGDARHYSSSDRDALLATLLDGVRASGNGDVLVSGQAGQWGRGRRVGPLGCPPDEDVEATYLRMLHTPPPIGNWSYSEILLRFNSNVPYSGLLNTATKEGFFAENKERQVQNALASVLDQEVPLEMIEAQLHALRRLFASKPGFAAFNQISRVRERVGQLVLKALKLDDVGVVHATIDMLCALMQPMHDNGDLYHEQQNKWALLSSKSFLETLLSSFVQHVERGTGALVVSALLDLLTFAMCPPYSETTDGAQFDSLLELVASHGRVVFQLFQHPSVAIVKGAGLVMRAIIEEGDAETSRRMQSLALAEAALPRHLHGALYGGGQESRLLALRQLCRHLVGLWVSGHEAAMAALKRMLPPGLLAFLEDPNKPPADASVPRPRDNLRLANDHSSSRAPSKAMQQLKAVERQVDKFLQHWRQRTPASSANDTVRPIVLRKRRQRVRVEANWPMFYHQFYQDHARPDLIWNFRTREELRDALEAELRSFCQDRSVCGAGLPVAWNHWEFEVLYPSLQEEVRVGDYFLRLLLEDDQPADGASSSYIRRSSEFFNDLYHAFLLASDPTRRCQCLQAMALVYGRHYMDIGPFNDTKHILSKLEKCMDRMERDRLLIFLSKLILHKRNVKELLDAGGLTTLVELVTLAHRHVSRALVPTQMNVIEASPDTVLCLEKEWHLGGEDKDRQGPYGYDQLQEMWAEGKLSARTLCWAQGMAGWQPLVRVAQLRWGLLASGQALLNDGELAAMVLSVLSSICSFYPSRDSDGAVVRPIPRAKRLLSERSSLVHIVQILLTFDPVLVEKVAQLLLQVMEENPAVQQLYATGFFYFVLLYTGSNLLTIGELLHKAHTCQAHRFDEGSSLTQRSILGPLLPEAMVCYLENHGAAKFAEIFLGEFDTPEAIWNAEMRRFMMGKIASHIGDFTPRLKSNTRAQYDYCPIPPVRYPQLQNELFCNIYYLRHLCDIQRFPDWPIKDPVALLRDVLERWRQELDRKPPPLSMEEACATLGVTQEQKSDDSVIRRAYFRLAQKYHPDKNPEGREQFEKVNKAYELLSDKTQRCSDGPDPINLQLLLKTQAILFSRHAKELEPYKYAGYGLLLRLMESELDDPQLRSKATPLLGVATETAWHTLRCSPLNVEELRREGGLQLLERALSCSVDMLSHSSQKGALEVDVMMHTAHCLGVAAQFPACRQALAIMQGLSRDLCRGLYFDHLSELCLALVRCVGALAVESALQAQLLAAGSLFHLLLSAFHYDYTLREGGVESALETNQQEVANRLAEESITACARLAGLDEACPPNAAARSALSALLTPYLARKLGVLPAPELLRILTANTENPYLLWDNATRAELREYLREQQRSVVRSGECDESYGANFVYSAHKEELVVGEIFVRIYNEQPTFPLENPRQFALDLLDFVGSQAQYLHSARSLDDNNVGQASGGIQRVAQTEQALQALHNVLRNNPGLESLCVGHFRLLFCLLSLDGCRGLQAVTVQVIQALTGSQECVSDIANSEVLVYLLLVLVTFKQAEQRLVVLDTLLPLVSNSRLVKEAIAKGAVVYLLDQWCNGTDETLRERAGELLAKMAADKLHGPLVRSTAGRFLPTVFLDAMRQGPKEALHVFQAQQENPELVWKEETRQRLCQTVRRMALEQWNLQKQDPKANCKLPAEFSLVEEDPSELVVAGVYVRLFVQNPGWTLRRPLEFLTECLDRICGLLAKEPLESDKEEGSPLEQLCTAACGVLQGQPNLRERLPVLGHLPQLCQALVRRPGLPGCLRILHQASSSQACAQSVGVACLDPLGRSLSCPESAQLACQTLLGLCQASVPGLVQQAVRGGLVEQLLNLLGKPSTSATTKAHAVQALKAMAADMASGDQVNNLLGQSTIWSDYKDQKHDLFMAPAATAGYLPSAGTAIAGYLTQGSSQHMPQTPPPLGES